MPAVPKHRRPIVDAAISLFRRQGYAGTGVNDIIDLSGAPKGSLYHYFPAGKASIAVASVEEAGQRVATTLGELAVTARSTGELLKAHARLLAGWMRKSGYRDGCPISTVLLELAPEDRAVAEAGRRAYAARLAVITDQLIRDGVSAGRAPRLATLCVSALQGALIQSRVERSGAPIEIAAAELARLLDASR